LLSRLPMSDRQRCRREQACQDGCDPQLHWLDLPQVTADG
jgi:hypothetical protein